MQNANRSPETPAQIQSGQQAKSSAMACQSTIPDAKNFDWIAQVIGRVVEQTVPETGAQHRSNQRIGHQWGRIDIRLSVTPGKKYYQPLTGKKGAEPGQPIPVNSQRAQLKGYRIKLPVNHHG